LQLDVVRSGCNLAEGERGGEDLDQNSIHCIDFRLTASASRTCRHAMIKATLGSEQPWIA
jgi:hypothetical protein